MQRTTATPITKHKMSIPDFKAETLKRAIGSQLDITDPSLKSVKVENLIGYSKVPLGVAGPLQISGQYQQNTVFAPLATTEATLVASCSRGCKALQASGGVSTAVLGDGMSRAPAFKFASVDDAVKSVLSPFSMLFFPSILKRSLDFTRLCVTTSSSSHGRRARRVRLDLESY